MAYQLGSYHASYASYPHDIVGRSGPYQSGFSISQLCQSSSTRKNNGGSFQKLLSQEESVQHPLPPLPGVLSILPQHHHHHHRHHQSHHHHHQRHSPHVPSGEALSRLRNQSTEVSTPSTQRQEALKSSDMDRVKGSEEDHQSADDKSFGGRSFRSLEAVCVKSDISASQASAATDATRGSLRSPIPKNSYESEGRSVVASSSIATTSTTPTAKLTLMHQNLLQELDNKDVASKSIASTTVRVPATGVKSEPVDLPTQTLGGVMCSYWGPDERCRSKGYHATRTKNNGSRFAPYFLSKCNN